MPAKRTLLLPVLALALTAAGAAPAQGRAPETYSYSTTKPMYFSSTMSGPNEVAAPGAATAGDPNGSAKSELEVNGNRLTFAFSWKGIAAPTMAHVHLGAAGVNGPVKVPLFTSAVPADTTGVAGVVTVTDPALVSAITMNPADFYLNLHNAEFPAGAVRGQLRPARRARPPLDLLRSLPLQTLMDGDSEVPVDGGPAVNDPDGQGIGMIRASGRRITYTMAWVGVNRPTQGHLHVGAAGTSGPMVVGLFLSPIPGNIYAVSGQIRDLDKHLVTAIRQMPHDYYLNLHSTEFPGGAIRGQLHRIGHHGS